MTRVHLVRHAKAKNRDEWTDSDDARPLTKRGRRQADALAGRIAADEPERIVSSPFVRCIQTVEPLAASLDLPIETTELLVEGADGAQALELLVSLASAGELVCCTHGDVLCDVVSAIEASGVRLDGPRDVPVAGTWLLEVTEARVVGGTFVDRPDRGL